MAGSTRLVDLVQEHIDGVLDQQSEDFAAISEDLTPIIDSVRDLLSGGKRYRALFCYWGWRAVAARRPGLDALDDSALDAELPVVVATASALELFHAAALVHDDIIDNSDTRRGRPAVHKQFESQHRELGWAGNARGYGGAAAVLIGDLLLGWSDEVLDGALRQHTSDAIATSTRREFNRMRSEVTAGQYLDVLEEASWATRLEEHHVARAERVVLYKSAKYSVEAPLVIGAHLAGAGASEVGALRRIGTPLGIAFQLRDDLLGVFGDPAITGKPAGDDLREGKRTVAVALTRRALSPGALRVFDELVGEQDLSDEQVNVLRQTMVECGTVDAIERLIARHASDAMATLDDAPLARAARDELRALAERVVRRSA